MNRIPESLSTLLAAALLCAAAGCAGPDEAPSSESIASHPGLAEPASPQPTTAEAPAPAPEPPAAEAPAPREPARRERPSPFALEPRPGPSRGGSYEEETDEPPFDFVVLALFGMRELDEDDWSPAENPFSSNLNVSARGPGGWFHWDLTVGFGDDDGTAIVEEGTVNEELVDLEVNIWEFDLGLVKYLDLGIVHPYFGIGAAIVNVDAEVSTVEGSASDDDTSIGGYGRAGLLFEVTKSGGLIGLDVRYLVGTDLNIFGVDTDVDGFQGLVSLGWTW